MAEKIKFFNNKEVYHKIKLGLISVDELREMIKPYVKDYVNQLTNVLDYCNANKIKRIICPAMGAIPLMTGLSIIKKRMNIDVELITIPTSSYLDRKDLEKLFKGIVNHLIMEWRDNNEDLVKFGLIDEYVSGSSLKKAYSSLKNGVKLLHDDFINNKLKGLINFPEFFEVHIFELRDVARIIFNEHKKSNSMINIDDEEFQKEVNDRINLLDNQRRRGGHIAESSLNKDRVKLRLIRTPFPVRSLFTEDLPVFTGMKYPTNFNFRIEGKDYLSKWDDKGRFINYNDERIEVKEVGDSAYIELDGRRVLGSIIEKDRLPFLISLKDREYHKMYKELVIKLLD